MATKYVGNIITDLFQHSANVLFPYFFNFTYVYVKRNAFVADHWQKRFFRCMGGMTNVICQYNNMPLILTNTQQEIRGSASDATGVNHTSAVAFHAMHIYANNVTLCVL
jgi:hypothetical protein